MMSSVDRRFSEGGGGGGVDGRWWCDGVAKRWGRHRFLGGGERGRKGEAVEAEGGEVKDNNGGGS
jgi:hypothetical protein